MRRNTEYARLFNTRALTHTAQCAHADTTTYSLYIHIYLVVKKEPRPKLCCFGRQTDK